MTATVSFFLFKAALSGLLIAAISSLAKLFPRWAALLTALPMVTFLSLIWIYLEHRDLKLLEVYILDVFLWTLPGIVFFIVAYFMFRSEFSFALTLVSSCLALALGLWLFQKTGWLK